MAHGHDGVGPGAGLAGHQQAASGRPLVRRRSQGLGGNGEHPQSQISYGLDRRRALLPSGPGPFGRDWRH
eukprot:15453687-Alexandrium_andersonii.AAC.1